MFKALIPGALIALGYVGFQHGQFDVPLLQLKEERMYLEYTPAKGEAVVVLEAESEASLGDVRIKSPRGVSVLELRAHGGQELAVSGFVVETGEMSATKLLQSYPEGHYEMRARSALGHPVIGGAVLSHELLAEPVVIYPQEGSTGVPTSNLIVSWIGDQQAAGYRVILEQDENDGLTVELPAGTESLQVPDRFLKSGTETLLEIGAIAPSGNTTLLEVLFTTS